jgi:4-hydroxythreonine-4-phosphate dehydrogenase
MPFPIWTPAHGTAYDIAGLGQASIGATRAAVLLAAGMAAQTRRSGVSPGAQAAGGGRP